MNSKDKIRLLDMLTEAKRAYNFAQGKSERDLYDDAMLAYAIAYCLMIIGEAASKVTVETRQLYGQLEWQKMIGMRNRIVHDYGNIDRTIVWNTVEDILPALILELDQILLSDSESEK